MPTLDYAPPLPWYRRKRFRRRLLALLTLTLLIAATYLLGPRCYRRAILLYWQHQCLNYTNPPGTVALDVPAATRRGTGRPPPAVWDTFNIQACSISPRWYLPIPYGSDEHFVFMHGRTCTAGQRLVVLMAHSDTSGLHTPGDRHAGIAPMVIVPFGLLSDADLQYGEHLRLRLHASETLRFYAGQPDPADPASLTVDFDLNGSRHTARFTLTPAGDHVTLTSVTPPIRTP